MLNALTPETGEQTRCVLADVQGPVWRSFRADFQAKQPNTLFDTRGSGLLGGCVSAQAVALLFVVLPDLGELRQGIGE